MKYEELFKVTLDMFKIDPKKAKNFKSEDVQGVFCEVLKAHKECYEYAENYLKQDSVYEKRGLIIL